MPNITPGTINQPPKTPQQIMQALKEKIEQATDPQQVKENQVKALMIQEKLADQLPNGPEKLEALQQVAEGYQTLGADQRAQHVEMKIKLLEQQMVRDTVAQDVSEVVDTIRRSTLSLW